MNDQVLLATASAILNRATQLGASLAGFASVADLKRAPSFTFAPKMPNAGDYLEVWGNDLGLEPGKTAWPEHAKTILVMGVAHPEDKPEMDWWLGLENPPGNRILIDLAKTLCAWIEETFGIKTVHLPYRVEKGGTYLKDAAVLSGLGCIGKNNLLVTPQLGPRIRLRALTLDVVLPPTGPVDFDPCALCEEFCRNACPRKAFGSQIYAPEAYDQDLLPGRDGRFFRTTCQLQMDIDEIPLGAPGDGAEPALPTIKYCRNCELTCPVGKEVK